MSLIRFTIVTLLLVYSTGCSTKPAPAEPIGEAYVAPLSLMIRKDLSPRSDVVATLKHSDRLDVLQIRRRFVRVRTAQGVEGWTDNRQLMTTAQMDRLHSMIEAAAKLPSQGRGTVYEALNIHSEPNRSAPSFYQIPENGSIEVIGRRIAPRVPYQSAVVVAPPPPAPKKTKKKKEATEAELAKVPVLPLPRPPKVPANWLELSRRDPLPDDPETKGELKQGPPPIKYDEWSLVRTKDGKSGWVLARMISMAIPDAVAQYAEGSRITSYFSLGEVKDEEGNTRNHWLWTTLSRSLDPNDFDGFRVFIFNTRRNRFETAYIERKVKGYYPVQTQTVEITEGRNRLTVPGFSLMTEDEDGQVWRRTFAFQGYRVRLVNKLPAEKPNPDSLTNDVDTSLLGKAAQAPQEVRSFMQRMKDKAKHWFSK